MNISSCDVVSPVIVSVPKCIKCLVVGDTIVNLDAVGLLVVVKPTVSVAALVVNLFAAVESHVNVLPFAIVATNTVP